MYGGVDPGWNVYSMLILSWNRIIWIMNRSSHSHKQWYELHALQCSADIYIYYNIYVYIYVLRKYGNIMVVDVITIRVATYQ